MLKKWSLSLLKGAALTVGLVIAVGSFAEYMGSREATPSQCGGPYQAYVAAQEAVTGRLKSPGSAEFPSIRSDGVLAQPLDGCTWRVSGYVDSQNGFGALVRSHYRVDATMDRESGRWQVGAVDIR